MRTPTRLLLSIAFGLILLELALRLAGFVYLQINSRPAETNASHAILCLGDSHTFGIWLKSDDAYPARLQKHIRDNKSNDAISVVNRGVPGMASADVLARLRECLHARTWDAVIVCVGANDRWKGADPSFFDHLQIVKTIKILIHQKPVPKPKLTDTNGVIHPDEIAGEATPGNDDTATVAIVDRSGTTVQFEQPTTAQLESNEAFDNKIVHNLKQIASDALAARAKVIFVSYASENGDLGLASRALERGAREAGVPFINLRTPADAAAKRFAAEDLYFSDLHPRAPLCELTARAICNELIAEKIVAGDPIADVAADLPVAHEVAETPFEISGALTTNNLEIAVRTDPGREIHLFLSFTEGPPADVVGSKIPIGDDALLKKTVDPANPKRTRATADASGIARIPIADLVAGAKPGAKLYVAAALLGLNGSPRLHILTGAKSFILN
ncbi:MAG: hypothetical protein HY286_11505 [Planctomycetes bacterium]|nr:hypothetical protein [Planctomycetota bacterium]